MSIAKPGRNRTRLQSIDQLQYGTLSIRKLLPIAIQATLILILLTTKLSFAEEQQAAANQVPSVVIETLPAAPSSDSSSIAAPSEPKPRADSNLAADESSKVAAETPKEALQSLESKTSIAQEQLSDQSGGANKYQQPIQILETAARVSDAEPQAIAQQAEEVPTVSSLDEVAPIQQQPQHQVIVDSGVSGDDQTQTNQQSANNNGQENNEQTQQQEAVRVGGEADLKSKNGPANQNDVQLSDQFGRKTATSGQEHLQGPVSNGKTSVKSRSIKRAFSGHLGVFGRKRAQHQSSYQEQQEEQQPARPSAVAAAATKSTQHTTNNHYYYAEPQQSTRVPPVQTTQALKLKNADYPDYREILIQPDQAEIQRQQQQQQQEVRQVVEEQPEQAQVGDVELTNSEQPVQVQQEVEQRQIPQQQEELQGPPQGSTPYIRLSNIATINSTSPGGNGSSGANQEMKLMRIYVIDLDQKLVVGNQNGAMSSAEDSNHASEQPQPEFAGPQYQQQQQQAEAAYEQRASTAAALASSPAAHHQPQQQHVPEAHVSVDRDLVSANLSQAHHHHQANLSAPLQNYSSPFALAQYSKEQPQPVPLSPASANVSGDNYQQQQQDAYGSGNSSSGLEAARSKVSVYYPILSGQAAVSSAAQHPEQTQAYQSSVPQYIAPQYKIDNPPPPPSANNSPDGDYPQQQHYEAPGQQQVRSNNNYTRPGAFPVVQAPFEQQDKHHANGSQRMVNQPMYQQQQQQQQPQADHQSAFGEPVQAQPIGPQPAYSAGPSEPGYGNHWRPVDYSAPVGQPAYSQTDSAQLPISSAESPAHSNPKSTSPFSQYAAGRDHDVVSLAYQQQQQPLPHQTGHNLSDGQHAPHSHWHKGQQRQRPNNGYANNEAAHIDSSVADYQPGAPVFEGPGQQQQQQVRHQSSYAHQFNGTDAAEAYQQNKTKSASVGYPQQQQQQQYGSNSLAAYGKQPDQSSSEAPRIPQAYAAVSPYKQTSSYNRLPSPYLTVSGPPIADGFYNSEQDAEIPQPPKPLKTRPTHNHNQKGASQYQKPRPPTKGRAKNHAKQHYKEMEMPAIGLDPSDQYQQASGEEADYRAHQGGRYKPQQPQFHRHPQNYHNQRPFYPGPQQRPLLSWETISSVASGAAKRLPSLSSIFSSIPTFGAQPYGSSVGVKANFAPVNYPKSAHYDRDVSNFHKPYPLRHMNSQQAPSYSDHSAMRSPHEAAAADEQYHSAHQQEDLSSSSSNDQAGSHETGGAEIAVSEQAAPGVENSESVEAESSYKNGTMSEEDSTRGGESVIGDLAEISGHANERPKMVRAKQAKGPRRPVSGAIKGDELAMTEPDASAAAVLTSIEHELASSTGASSLLELSKSQSKPKLKRKRPGITEFLEPSVGSSQVQGLESLPADRQRLLMHPSGKSPLKNFEGSLEGSFAQTGAEPMEGPRPHHRQPASMHIGQFKITPQTQFVQSIIEPSRQMLGQYFKQYIGQLHQFAG